MTSRRVASSASGRRGRDSPGSGEPSAVMARSCIRPLQNAMNNAAEQCMMVMKPRDSNIQIKQKGTMKADRFGRRTVCSGWQPRHTPNKAATSCSSKATSCAARSRRPRSVLRAQQPVQAAREGCVAHRVTDQDGKPFDDKGLKVLEGATAGRPKVAARYGHHPGNAAAENDRSSGPRPGSCRTISSGTFVYKVTATTSDGKTQTGNTFKVKASQFAVVAGKSKSSKRGSWS